jgi:hypothetical protein
MNKILIVLFVILLAGCGSVSAANDYYNATGAPASGSSLSSATMRAEFAAVGDGFDALPDMTGNGGEIVVVNGSETGLEAGTVESVVGATKTEITTLTDGSDSSALHNHTTANLNDTTATGANLNTLTDASDASSLHNHTTANLNDTTATGANLNTLTGGSNASALHSHTTANLNDTTATGANLNTLTDSSNADALHTHAIVSGTTNGENLFVNPNFIVNQKVYIDGTDFSSIGEYGYDMWMSYNTTASNGVSVSGETVTLESATQQEQINDDLIANSGKTVIISVASGSLEVSGGGITGTQTINSTTAYSFALAVTTTNGIVIEYSSASSGVFTGLKLEVGSVATDYQIPKISEEEFKSYRYFYRLSTILDGGVNGKTALIGAGHTAGTTYIHMVAVLPCALAKTPTIILTDHGDNNKLQLSWDGNLSSLAIVTASFSQIETIGNTVEYRIAGWSSLVAAHAGILKLDGETDEKVTLDFDARY